MLVVMVDIHCHLLPGLDDGAETMEESVQMAEMALADGITHVVATPHSSDTFRFDLERNLELCRDLRERLGGRLQLGTGCDFHLSYENIEAAEADPKRFTINQKNYLLIEFADFALPPTLDQALERLQQAGMRLIVTHPERNGLIRNAPERLRRWIESGCYVQITAQSLTGRFGPSAQRSAEKLLQSDWVHFVASDAHSTRSRPLQLRAAYDLVVKEHSQETARALFHDNPMAAWNGEPLPRAPEMEAQAQQPSGWRRFFPPRATGQ